MTEPTIDAHGRETIAGMPAQSKPQTARTTKAEAPVTNAAAISVQGVIMTMSVRR